MKLEIVPQVKQEYILTLSSEELGLLCSLIDFPDWEKQPEAIQDFLITMNQTCADVGDGFYVLAREQGFVDATSV